MKAAIITTTITLIALVCLAAAPNTSPTPETPEVKQLRLNFADLALRVSRLEHAGGVTPGAVDGKQSDDPTEHVPRSMVVGGTSTFEGPAADPNDVANLKQDINSLGNTMNSYKDAGSMVASGAYYNSGYYSDGHYGYRHTNEGRNRAEVAARTAANRYGQEEGAKKKELEQMQRQANEPRQIINGHDGDVVFTLRTKHDLSKELEDIEVGDTVTWKGTRVSGDTNSETWEITIIRKIARD